jgi:hypothetical protein
MTRSGWINAEDLLSERSQLRAEVARLQAENERLRSALVEEVLADARGRSEHAIDEASVSSNGRSCRARGL